MNILLDGRKKSEGQVTHLNPITTTFQVLKIVTPRESVQSGSIMFSYRIPGFQEADPYWLRAKMPFPQEELMSQKEWFTSGSRVMCSN